MIVKDYVTGIINNSAKYRQMNVGEELWFHLYTLLNIYSIRHNDVVAECSEDLQRYMDLVETEYIHHYSHIRSEQVKPPK